MAVRQITNTVLLVKPKRFYKNDQTATTNFFQQGDLDADEATKRCHDEFFGLQEILRKQGVSVILFEQTNPDAVDAIFPNNWFSTHDDGTLVLYPMYAKNRRLERSPALIDDFKRRFACTRVVDLTHFESKDKFCEGTGSLVLDRLFKIAYCALSPRSDIEVIEAYCDALGYQSLVFHATQEHESSRVPIYHTNVMMSLGEGFATVCLDSIESSAERNKLLASLERTGKKVIEISLAQMSEFAGNSLQILGSQDRSLLALSERAYKSLLPEQIKSYESFVMPIFAPLGTIEELGGGSARCMIAEIFL